MSNENHTTKWIAILVMSVSLTFAIVTSGFAISLSARVKDNEHVIGTMSVTLGIILEKTSNIEDDIKEIKEELRDD